MLAQTLLIDADDTLWENNIYFERAIAAYISYLDHQVHTPQQVRQALNQAERETILSHGYGLTSFTQSLVTCFERLTQAPIGDHQHAQIRSFAQSIADQEIELLPAVAELVPELASRHRLILMTKGSQSEQADKLARSGLAPYFSGVEIVAEKNPAAYLEVARRNLLDTRATWMIGNSPKSDINPALAAGLHAVFIFHKDTWVLEHAEIAPGASRPATDSNRFLLKTRHNLLTLSSSKNKKRDPQSGPRSWFHYPRLTRRPILSRP